MKQLSVIIVSYNARHFLGACLQSVQCAMEGMDGEVIVVDNQSHDGTVDWLRAQCPEVCVVESGGNLGFAKASNIGIRRSSGRYVLLLNPDTVVSVHCLRQAVDFMVHHPQVGAAGVQMLNADGTRAPESRRGLPTPMVAFYKMCGLAHLFPRSHRFARYYMSWLPWSEPAEIEVVSGAFFLLRREALDRVGLLDEDFFMYGEDIDLSCRLLADGWHNCYLPCKIVHYKGGCSDKASVFYVRMFYRAMVVYYRKHHGGAPFCVRKCIELAVWLRMLFALIGILPSRLVRTRTKTVITPQDPLQ